VLLEEPVMVVVMVVIVTALQMVLVMVLVALRAHEMVCLVVLAH